MNELAYLLDDKEEDRTERCLLLAIGSCSDLSTHLLEECRVDGEQLVDIGEHRYDLFLR